MAVPGAYGVPLRPQVRYTPSPGSVEGSKDKYRQGGQKGGTNGF